VNVNVPDICPTEAQVVAWLNRYGTRELWNLSEWNGCTPFENACFAVDRGTLTWRELFDSPEEALAQAFDDWRYDMEVEEW
jgi:hypothetical protein